MLLSHFFRNGIENLSVIFTKPDKRTSWEESFSEAKQKLGECAVDFVYKQKSLHIFTSFIENVYAFWEIRDSLSDLFIFFAWNKCLILHKIENKLYCITENWSILQKVYYYSISFIVKISGVVDVYNFVLYISITDYVSQQ